MLLVGRASASSHRSYPRQSSARRDGCVVGVRSNHGMDGPPCLPVFYQRLDRHPRVLPRRSLASSSRSYCPGMRVSSMNHGSVPTFGTTHSRVVSIRSHRMVHLPILHGRFQFHAHVDRALRGVLACSPWDGSVFGIHSSDRDGWGGWRRGS